MRSFVRPALLAGCIAGLLGLAAELGRADDEKELREGLVKLAAALEKKDDGEAKKLTETLAKKFDMEALMFMHAERSKGGLGVGQKADEAKPDGIEKKIIALSKKPLPQDQLNTEADALTHLGWRMAALAEVTAAMAPDKNKKAWLDSSVEYKNAGLQMADGAKAKKADVVLQAAKKADASCLKCHDAFR